MCHSQLFHHSKSETEISSLLNNVTSYFLYHTSDYELRGKVMILKLVSAIFL